MVQVTKVRVEGTKGFLFADQWDVIANQQSPLSSKDNDSKRTCLCPDPQCHARMVHIRAHDHTYYDEQGAYTLRVAPYFRRHPKSPPHVPQCGVALAYHRYADQARHNGGIRRADIGFVYNLNIMTDTAPAPRRGLARHFPSANIVPQVRAQYAAHTRGAAPAPWSQGISHIKKLARLLDETAFDTGLRAQNHMRRNGVLMTLADMYKEDAVALFRAGHDRSKALEEKASLPHSTPMLFNFRPIMTPRSKERTFWDARNRRVTGAPQKIEDAEGNTYYVSARLNFGSNDLYKAFTDLLRAGEKSFLIYDDRVSVDLENFMRTREKIYNGDAAHGAVFVDMHINCTDQLIPWTPPGAQLDLSNHMDMPLAPRRGGKGMEAAKRPWSGNDAQLKLPL